MKEKRTKKSKAPIIIAGVAVAVSLIVVLGYLELGTEDPVEIYYNLKFQNGSKIWVPAEVEMPFTLSNGTIINVTPEKLLTIVKFETFQIKTINLKDGTTNFYLHQTEAMGASSKLRP